MTKLKGRRGKHFVGDARQISKPSAALDSDADRTRLIRECLRDLAGVELIYAMRCSDGLIKIGWTRDLMSRRRHFAPCDYPEAILAITPGTYEAEQAVHAQLAASVGRGQEYYHPTPEVLAYVNGLRSALGVEPVE